MACGATTEWMNLHDIELRLERHGPGDAPATVVLLHGGGGNARVLAPFAAMAADEGFAAVAPDLPGFGGTRVPHKRTLRYQDWVTAASAVVSAQARRGPVVVFGASLGGLLAYDVAALTGAPRELLVTCLLDPRDAATRHAMTGSSLLSAAIPLLLAARPLLAPLPVPMRLVSDMDAIANDPDVARALSRDPRAGGTWMPARWLLDLLEHRPVVEPEQFDVCPITVLHPDQDRWTPPELTEPLLSRVHRVPTRMVMLRNCGHLPMEEPGLSMLRTEMVRALRAAGEGG